MKLVFAATLALLAAPAFADAMMAEDAMKLTCKDLMAMDAMGMMEAGKALNTAMMADDTAMADGAMADDTATADDTAMKDGMMSDEDMMKAAEAACAAHPDAMVMDAMKM